MKVSDLRSKKNAFLTFVAVAIIFVISACDNSKSMSVVGTEWTQLVIYNNAIIVSNLVFIDDNLCQYSYGWSMRGQSGYYEKDSLKMDFRYKKTEKIITLTPINIENGADWEAEIYKKDKIKFNNTGDIQIQIDENSKTLSRKK